MAPLAIHRHARTTWGRLRPSSSRQLSREGSGVRSTAGRHSLAAASSSSAAPGVGSDGSDGSGGACVGGGDDGGVVKLNRLRKTARLPNGMSVHYVSPPDVQFLYHEIFDEAGNVPTVSSHAHAGLIDKPRHLNRNRNRSQPPSLTSNG